VVGGGPDRAQLAKRLQEGDPLGADTSMLSATER